MLLSVPYALKAGDAATGLPPSAFVLAGRPSSESAQMSPSSSAGVNPSTVGGGATNYTPLWSNSATLDNSVLIQSGSGNTAKGGMNTATFAV